MKKLNDTQRCSLKNPTMLSSRGFQSGWKFFSLIILSVAVMFLSGGEAYAVDHSVEVNTAFAKVQFDRKSDLKEFTRSVGCTMESTVCLGSNSMLEASVGMIIGSMVDDIKNLLELYPKDLQFHIHVMSNPKDVQKIYQSLYDDKKDYIAFYSPQNKTIYVAAGGLKNSVLRRQLVYAVVDSYFEEAPPAVVHQLLAKYVEGESIRKTF